MKYQEEEEEREIERGKLAYLRVELELYHLADSGCDGVRGELYRASRIADLDYVVFYASTWSWG